MFLKGRPRGADAGTRLSKKKNNNNNQPTNQQGKVVNPINVFKVYGQSRETENGAPVAYVMQGDTQ